MSGLGRGCVKTLHALSTAFLRCNSGARRFYSSQLSSLKFAESNVRETVRVFSHSLQVPGFLFLGEANTYAPRCRLRHAACMDDLTDDYDLFLDAV
jgi:hypothetical protein